LSRTPRSGALPALVLAAAMLLAGCGGSQTPQVTVQQNANGSLTVTVLPPAGSNGQPQTVLLPPGVVPPTVVNQLTHQQQKAPPPTVSKPGNGGQAGPDPKQVVPTTPNPPPTVVQNPAKPAQPTGSATDKTRIESDFGVQITGKDMNNAEYLTMLRGALSLYPAGTMRGLQVVLDEESLDKTGGVGGVWQEDGTHAWVTIYQAGSQYIHVSIHELAHQLDLGDNNGNITTQLISAASVNGQVANQNIASPYAKYGLETAQHQPEFGAETISWSLDARGVTGFQTYATWHPTSAVIKTLGQYVDPSKIIYK